MKNKLNKLECLECLKKCLGKNSCAISMLGTWARTLRKKWLTLNEKADSPISFVILIFLYIAFGTLAVLTLRQDGYFKLKVDTSTCYTSCTTPDNLSSITLIRLNKSDCLSNVDGEITTCRMMLSKSIRDGNRS